MGRQIGHAVGASLSYTYGEASRAEGAVEPGVASLRDADFQDLAARLEAVLRTSDTRLAAFYRINTLRNNMQGFGPQAPFNSRFDVQVRQGLPFLGGLTRADWELLVAIRNLFYEEEEAGLLDEFAVANPPVRVVGGISVRF